jgi:hypothetical protein
MAINSGEMMSAAVTIIKLKNCHNEIQHLEILSISSVI